MTTGVTRSARADVQACIDAHASGQREAMAGRLKRAAELFASCGSSEECPEAIRTECVDFYRDTERNVPTVILRAVDAQGKDLTDVRVYSGEELLTESLDGRALALDPGKYALRFIDPKGTIVRRDVLVREGEKNRAVSVRMPRRTDTDSDAEVTHTPAEGGIDQESLPAAFWISAGVGAAALTSWGVFALLGRARESELSECSPNCGPSRRNDFDTMRRDYLIADVSLGVAVASAGVAAWLYFPSQRSPATEGSSGTHGPVTQVFLQPLISTPGAVFTLKTGAF